MASDQWHALRVILKGNSFEVSLDDKPLFKATDASLPQPGTVGVWSQADSLIRFGSLVVAPAALISGEAEAELDGDDQVVDRDAGQDQAEHAADDLDAAAAEHAVQEARHRIEAEQDHQADHELTGRDRLLREGARVVVGQQHHGQHRARPGDAGNGQRIDRPIEQRRPRPGSPRPPR